MACIIWTGTNEPADLISKLFANEEIEAKENKWIWSVKNKYYSCKVDIHILTGQLESSLCSEISNIGAAIWCTTQAKKRRYRAFDQMEKRI